MKNSAPNFFNQMTDLCNFVTIDERKKLEDALGNPLPLEAWLLLSLKNKDLESDDGDTECRILDLDEILSASEDMEVDFLKEKLVPLVDCFDNDYLVYDFSKQIFCMFNISDEMSFSDYKNLDEFLQEILGEDDDDD